MKIVKKGADKNSKKKVNSLELATGVSMRTVAQQVSFGLRIHNNQLATQDAKRIAFNPGKFDSISQMSSYGLSVDALLADGEIVTDGVNGDVNVYAKDSQLKVGQLIKDMREGFFRLERMIISSDNEDVFEQQIQFTMNSSFGKPEIINIDMTGWADEYQNNSKKATVDLVNENKQMILSKDSVMIWPVPPQTNLNITLIGTWVRTQPNL
jgi:hypothetical protein